MTKIDIKKNCWIDFPKVGAIDKSKIPDGFSLVYDANIDRIKLNPFFILRFFKYRIPITITEQSGNTLTDYQVLITINTQELINQGKMRSDCGDIRFTWFNPNTGKEEKIPYWIESGCGTTSTKIWIKVPKIPANGEARVYMYYGNPDATSESNAANVFIREIDGLVGAWQFDEGSGTTAYDTSGNNNHGTIYGATWVDGKFGKALEFDGVDDYVEIPDLITNNVGTISVWIKPFSMKEQTIFDASNSKTLKYFYLDIDSRGYLRFWIEDVRDYDYQGASYDVSSLPADKWYHIVGIWRYKSSPATQLYFNGNLVAQDTRAPDNIPDFYSGYIGKSRSNYESYWKFKGLIDQVLIFNKALTEKEIQDLYNNYGYTTTNYPGKVLVRKYVNPEPTYSIGQEESFV